MVRFVCSTIGFLVFAASSVVLGQPSGTQAPPANSPIKKLSGEKLSGEGVWVMPGVGQPNQAGRPVRVVVWFEDQFLGSGDAYRKRAKQLADWKRRDLRQAVVATLKDLNDSSYAAARQPLEELVKAGVVTNLQRHWIVNGFSCNLKPDGLEQLAEVPGVRKIFRVPGRGGRPAGRLNRGGIVKAVPKAERRKFDADRYLHPWYTRVLMADRVWTEFGVTGQNTLNVVHDFNFVLTDSFAANIYRNPNEVPDNGKDDDQNGLVDDVHGYNFQLDSPRLTMAAAGNSARPQLLHGSMCAAIVCGTPTGSGKHEFGIAPEGRWAGVIGSSQIEAAVEWAVEQQADTYSMSFSMPGLGEFRSHWRKVMEHGSLCGVYFVSGAGNFAQSARIPVQMRTPEDIPDVVFAAAGVQRNLARTPFSSKGPVAWELEHYQDGQVQKPEVCAFNMGLPMQLPNGTVQPVAINGNSFAGPMFCGSIALMLSADPDLLPWDLKEIITSTAMDVGPAGVDHETGHGLINCYRAVKEVLRRKAVREGKDASRYEGRQPNDELDVKAHQQKLKPRFTVVRVQANSPAAKKGVRPGDVIAKCAGKPVANMQQFRAAKAAASQDKPETIAIEFLRDDKTITVKFVPGAWGMFAGPAFPEPVFQ